MFSLSYGVTDALEIGVSMPFDRVSDENRTTGGGGDLEIEGLYCFYQTPALTLSAISRVTFPTGDADRNLGSGRAEAEIELAAGWRFGGSELIGSIGAQFERGEQPGAIFSIAAMTGVGAGAVILEVTGSFSDSTEIYLTPGYAIQLGDHYAISIGVPVGMTDDSDPWGIICTLSYEG